MSFVARNGLISRVEQNCSHKGLTHNKWVKRIEREATENKHYNHRRIRRDGLCHFGRFCYICIRKWVCVRHFHAEKGETATKENLRKSRVPLDAVNHRLHTHAFCQTSGAKKEGTTAKNWPEGCVCYFGR
jgi:hypothetical protein